MRQCREDLHRRRLANTKSQKFRVRAIMYCTEDCTCSLCRELRGYRLNVTGSQIRGNSCAKNGAKSKATDMFHVGNSNFILRRSRTDLNKHQPMSAVAQRPAKVCEMPKSRGGTRATATATTMTDRERARPDGGSDATCASHRRSGATDRSTSTAAASESAAPPPPPRPPQVDPQQHKVIIYFGDSLSSKQQLEQAERIHQQSNVAVPVRADTPADNACVAAGNSTTVVMQCDTATTPTPVKPDRADELPSYVESIEGSVINIRVEGSYARALDIVRAVSDASGDQRQDEDMGASAPSGEGFDWSFVQNWRTR